jgi:drug/metabolite transporter (DMT)-like permease
MILKNETKKYSLLLLLAMALWGGGWSALKILTYELPLEVIVFWRFFFMTLAFIPILYLFPQPLRVDTKALKYIAGSSILNVAFMVSSFMGIKYGLAGSGSVIITTFSPIITFLFVAILFRKRLSNTQYFGLFLGLVGGAILVQLYDIDLFFNGANGYFLLCATIWAGVTILSQHSQKHIHPVQYSFIIAVIATIFTFLYAYDAPLGSVFSQGVVFWVALLYLAILGQAVATTIFFIASGKLGSEKTSSFMFLVPVFALLSASVLLGEPLESHIIVGGLVSMVAVWFINKK